MRQQHQFFSVYPLKIAKKIPYIWEDLIALDRLFAKWTSESSKFMQIYEISYFFRKSSENGTFYPYNFEEKVPLLWRDKQKIVFLSLWQRDTFLRGHIRRLQRATLPKSVARWQAWNINNIINLAVWYIPIMTAAVFDRSWYPWPHNPAAQERLCVLARFICDMHKLRQPRLARS